MQDVIDHVLQSASYIELQISALRPLPDRLISLLDLTANAGFKGLMLNWGSSFPWTIGPFADNRSSYSEEVVQGVTEQADRLDLDFIHKIPLIGNGNLFSPFPAYHDLSCCLETGEGFSKHSKRYRSIILDHLEDFFSLLPQARYICLDADTMPQKMISPREIREGLIIPISSFLSDQACRLLSRGDYFLQAGEDSLSSLAPTIIPYLSLTGDLPAKLSSLRKAGLPLVLKAAAPEDKTALEEGGMEEGADIFILNPKSFPSDRRLTDYTLEKQLETAINLKNSLFSSKFCGESPDFTEALSDLDCALEAAWADIRMIRESLAMKDLLKHGRPFSGKTASLICEELGGKICDISRSIERLEEKLKSYYEEKETRTLLRSRLLPLEEEYGMLAPRARTLSEEL